MHILSKQFGDLREAIIGAASKGVIQFTATFDLERVKKAQPRTISSDFVRSLLWSNYPLTRVMTEDGWCICSKYWVLGWNEKNNCSYLVSVEKERLKNS